MPKFVNTQNYQSLGRTIVWYLPCSLALVARDVEIYRLSSLMRTTNRKRSTVYKTLQDYRDSGDNCIIHALYTLTFLLVFAGCLFAPAPLLGTELKQDTLVHWNAYVQQAASQQEASKASFLWVDQNPERLQSVREGEILVSSVGKENPKSVESGLIHDWLGAAFLPDTSISDVMAAVRDYGNYKEYYKPTVVDSKLLNRDGSCETYSMRVVNKETVAETALDMEYETC